MAGTLALRHGLTVALAHDGSPTGKLASAGRGAILAETGELLTQLEARGAGVAVASETPRCWRAKTFMLSP